MSHIHYYYSLRFHLFYIKIIMLAVSPSLSPFSLPQSSRSEEAPAQKIQRVQAGHACVPVNNLQWTQREGAMAGDEPDFMNTPYNSPRFLMSYDDVSCPLCVHFISRSLPLYFSVSFLILLLLLI